MTNDELKKINEQDHGIPIDSPIYDLVEYLGGLLDD